MAEAEQLEAIKALQRKQQESRKADLGKKNAAMRDKQNAFEQARKNATPTDSSSIHGVTQPPGAQVAAQNRFKGKYAGPDKYKGKIPEGYKGKAKGAYFGKDSRKGANVSVNGKPEKLPGKKPVSGQHKMPVGHAEWQKRADEAKKAGRSYIQGWATS